MTQIVLPVPPDIFWGLLLLIVLILGSLVVCALLKIPTEQGPDPLHQLKASLGLDRFADWLVVLISLVWILLFLALLGGLCVTIGQVILKVPTLIGEESSDLRNLLFLLAALTATAGAAVAVPITLVRLKLTGEQTKTAAAALFNENINAAAALFNENINAASAELHAMRTITRETIDPEQGNIWREVQEADVVRRNVAIDRLHGLAREQPKEAERIARMLGTYVRELSQEEGLKPKDPPKDAIPYQLRDWGRTLKPVRSDMESAVQVLGRLHQIDPKTFKGNWIDLRNTNLQGFDLRGLCYDGANMQNAYFHGAQMQGVQLNDADLFYAHLQGADLFYAHMQKTNLSYAHMQEAELGGAQMQGANLAWAKMQSAHPASVQMQGANLEGTDLRDANLNEAHLQNAHFHGAHLMGANLEGAQMQGVDLFCAQMDARTNLRWANLRGAALQSGDYTNVPQIVDHLDTLFGDATVKLPVLPDGVTAPGRFAKRYADRDQFKTAWRAWQAAIGFDPDDPDTWQAPGGDG